jgi:GGDEF domain-containing protein
MKADAEAAIRRALEGDAQGYVAMFYLHRMHLINARFGDAIGNQVILFCSQHIATHLTGATDALFRWRGPGFVALLERSDSALAVASEVQRFTSMPLSRFFETPSRTVYLPIKLTGEVLALHGKTFEEVLTSVQHSLHTHGETGD